MMRRRMMMMLMMINDKDVDRHPMLRRKAVDSRRGRRTMSTSLCIIIWKTKMMTI